MTELLGHQKPLLLEDARYQVLAPTAIGEIVSGLESLTTLDHYGDNGLLRGRSALREQSSIPLPLRRALDTKEGAAALKVLSVLGGSLTLFGRRSRGQQIGGATLMLLANSITEYRNPYGRDGSDQMAEVITGYRVLTALVPDQIIADDLFLRAVNAQTCVSYLASGFAKAISSTWLSGEALELILNTQQYGDSWAAKLLKKDRKLLKALTWFTIAWETGYVSIYALSPAAARRALTGIKSFHLGIAAVMGLPRFFWGFSSAHASVRYVMDNRREES